MFYYTLTIKLNQLPAHNVSNTLCRNFIGESTFNVRKCHLISWKTCTPKEDVGLGFS